MLPALMRDREVAALIGMSPSWIRVQRHKRKKNEPHAFNLDAVLIGSAPRYKVAEVHAWLESLERTSTLNEEGEGN